MAVGVEELDCRGISGYGSNSGVTGVVEAAASACVSRRDFISWASRNRLIFSQISWSDGVAAPGVSGVAAGPLPPGLVSGVAVQVGVGVVCGVGGRSGRGAVWVVEVVVGAGCFGVP